MINQAELPLFNPLKIENDATQGNNNVIEVDNGNQANHRQWKDLAKQLSNAINICIAYWEKSINRILAEIKIKVYENYSEETEDRHIKAVNTCLKRILHNKIIKEVQKIIILKNTTLLY